MPCFMVRMACPRAYKSSYV